MANKTKLGKKLSKAVSNGDIIAVERLLAEGADPNFQGTFFHSAPLLIYILIGGGQDDEK